MLAILILGAVFRSDAILRVNAPGRMRGGVLAVNGNLTVIDRYNEKDWKQHISGSSGRNWSGRWDLNPRQLAWEARTLPLSYARSLRYVAHLRFQLLRLPAQVLLPC